MAPEVLKYLFTVDEFERMGEGRVFGEDGRVELLDGEIVKMTPIGTQHAGCVNWLNRTIASRAGTTAIVGIQNPVVLDEQTELYPDVTVLKSRQDSYRRAHPRPADVLLVIEVADTSAEYDRTIKARRYARAGIAELWVVDLQERAVDVYRQPAGGEYQERIRVGPDASLQVPGIDTDVSVNEMLG